MIDTLKAENDTSKWDNDEWVKQIWYYQNRKIINAMDPHASLEDQLRSQYGNYKVDFIESSYDTTGWTTEDWLDALWERVDMADDTAQGNSDVPDPYEDIYDDQYETDPNPYEDIFEDQYEDDEAIEGGSGASIRTQRMFLCLFFQKVLNGREMY